MQSPTEFNAELLSDVAENSKTVARQGYLRTARQMWLWAVLFPICVFMCLNMCVWPAPRFLRFPALMLLTFGALSILSVLIAVPASVWFFVSAGIFRKKEGFERLSKSLACVFFIGLWCLAVGSSLALRHWAFVQASHVGDLIVKNLTSYRNDKGEYPESLEQLVPNYLEQIPYTGMIAFPNFDYVKDYNDIQPKPGDYELRINCTRGGLNFDRFIYWPSETYPDFIQGNRVERIRNWAYVHE